MALLFDRIRIQNKLVEVGVAGPFYPVSYDPTTHVALAGTTPITPASVIANETNCQFQEAQLNRRKLYQDRDLWTFQLKIRFDQEAIFEAFETLILNSPPMLVRDSANGLDFQVTLRLRSVEYTHPIQQESATGSHATYTFEARLTPR